MSQTDLDIIEAEEMLFWSQSLNDGNWHRIELTLKNKMGRITVDSNTEAFETPGKYRPAQKVVHTKLWLTK